LFFLNFIFFNFFFFFKKKKKVGELTKMVGNCP